jgi:hypothetical protein
MDDDWMERATAKCSDPVIVYRVMMKELSHRFEQVKLENSVLRAEVRALRVQHQKEADGRLAATPVRGGARRRCASAACRHQGAASPALDPSEASLHQSANTSCLPSQIATPAKPSRSVGDFGLNVSDAQLLRRREVSTAATMTSPVVSPRPAHRIPELAISHAHQLRTVALHDTMVQTTPRRGSDSGGAARQGALSPRATRHDAQTEITPPKPLPLEERPAMCLPNATTSVVLTTVLRHLLLLAMQDDRVVAARGAAAALPTHIELGGAEVSRLLDAVVGTVVQLKRRVVAASVDATRHLEAAAARPPLVASPAVPLGQPGSFQHKQGDRHQHKLPVAASLPVPVAFDHRIPVPAERQLMPIVADARPRESLLSPSSAAAVPPLSVSDLQSSPGGKSVRSSGPHSGTVFSTLCGDKEMAEYEQWRQDFARRVFGTGEGSAVL